MIREPPPFFHRGPSPLARLTFFTIVAIAIMIADHRFHALESVRLSLSVLAHPVQQLASAPADVLGRAADYFASQDRLLRENGELKAKILEQSSLAQEARLLRGEHQQLLALSSSRPRYDERGIIAEVIYTARNPFTRKIVVDKGLTQAIQAGMPVIDGEGVVGQVTTVGTFTSEVTLVTEKDQSVPVMLVRNGLRAVAVGSGKDGSIDVPFMPVSADIQNGDLFVTSGIDGTYPAGLVVARGELGGEECRVCLREDLGEARCGRRQPSLRDDPSFAAVGAAAPRDEGRGPQTQRALQGQTRCGPLT
jgi:rod shape-determining protein MreC